MLRNPCGCRKASAGTRPAEAVAIIVARATGLRILDDRSTNGTVVNGRRPDEAELHDGDVVVLGHVVLTYRDLR